VLFVVSVLLASVPSEPSHPPHKPRLKSIRCSRVLTFTLPSPVLVSRNFARTSSDQPLPPSTVSSPMQRSTNQRFTRLSSSEVPLVFPESKSSLLTISTVRSLTSQSTPMRLLPMVRPSRLLFFPATPLPSQLTRFFFSMLRHCPWVLRLLVAR